MTDYGAEYQKKISDLSASGDPIEALTETPPLLFGLLDGIDEEVLRKRPAPDKWSVGEIIAHLADDEIAAAWRYRQMIENPGVELGAFDQDFWAEVGNNSAADPKRSLILFTLLREMNVRMLQRLKEEQWDCHGTHPERGKMTVRSLATHLTGHDANHVQQIRKIIEK